MSPVDLAWSGGLTSGLTAAFSEKERDRGYNNHHTAETGEEFEPEQVFSLPVYELMASGLAASRLGLL